MMRYGAAYKPVSEPLDQFVKRKGAINECAARFLSDEGVQWAARPIRSAF
jgi:hypothetical protein